MNELSPAFDTIELSMQLAFELNADEFAFDEFGEAFVEPKVLPTTIGYLLMN